MDEVTAPDLERRIRSLLPPPPDPPPIELPQRPSPGDALPT